MADRPYRVIVVSAAPGMLAEGCCPVLTPAEFEARLNRLHDQGYEVDFVHYIEAPTRPPHAPFSRGVADCLMAVLKEKEL